MNQYVHVIILFILFLFIGIETGYAQRATCHIDTACNNETLGFENAVFMFNGCTAYFVNNTQNDGRLLFFTKNHCVSLFWYEGSTYAANLKFNYQKQTCNSLTISPQYSSVTANVKLLEKQSNSDRALFEIADATQLPNTLTVRLLGWSLSSPKSPTQSYVIGHPVQDLKSVTKFDNVSVIGSFLISHVNQNNGFVEIGNSGSPVFNSNFQVIADVTNGSIGSCTATPRAIVYSALFSVDYHSAFKSFLDPNNTNASELNYYDVVLPVELSYFNYIVENNKLILKWQTVSETNNSGFEIEYRNLSTTNENEMFTTLSFVNGCGTTIEKQDYAYEIHEKLPFGSYEFRLNQINYDGRYTYSDIIKVEYYTHDFNLNIYPTVTYNTISITSLSYDSYKCNIQLHDILGRKLLNEDIQISNQKHLLSLAKHSPGVYILYANCNNNSIVASKRIVKVK